MVGRKPGLHGNAGMVCAVLIIAWHLFVLGLGIVIGVTIECNMEEDMRELIALRAKIDLIISDYDEAIKDAGDGVIMYIPECRKYAGKTYRDAMIQVTEMIDEMVGKQLEEMYAEHIQEEAKADRH